MGFTTGEPKDNGQLKVHEKVIEGNDYVALSEAIGKAKERFKLDAGCRVVSGYEAGQDGFWPHRQLTERQGSTTGWLTRRVSKLTVGVGGPSRTGWR